MFETSTPSSPLFRLFAPGQPTEAKKWNSPGVTRGLAPTLTHTSRASLACAARMASWFTKNTSCRLDRHRRSLVIRPHLPNLRPEHRAQPRPGNHRHRRVIREQPWPLTARAERGKTKNSKRVEEYQSPCVIVHMPKGLAIVPFPTVSVVRCRPT